MVFSDQDIDEIWFGMHVITIGDTITAEDYDGKEIFMCASEEDTDWLDKLCLVVKEKYNIEIVYELRKNMAYIKLKP